MKENGKADVLKEIVFLVVISKVDENTLMGTSENTNFVLKIIEDELEWSEHVQQSKHIWNKWNRYFLV